MLTDEGAHERGTGPHVVEADHRVAVHEVEVVVGGRVPGEVDVEEVGQTILAAEEQTPREQVPSGGEGASAP